MAGPQRTGMLCQRVLTCSVAKQKCRDLLVRVHQIYVHKDDYSASLKQLNFKELRKHQELAFHHFINGNEFFVSLPTGSGKSLCYWMLQAAFNTLRDRADCISMPWLHFYCVTLPIIVFHVVTEYGPETPDPFSPRTSGHAHQQGEKVISCLRD